MKKRVIIAISLIGFSLVASIAFFTITPMNYVSYNLAGTDNSELGDVFSVNHYVNSYNYSFESQYNFTDENSNVHIWINDGIEDRLVMIVENNNLEIEESYTIKDFSIELYDARLDNYIDTSVTKNAFSGLDYGVSGDESYWNIWITMMSTTKKINGTQNFTWVDVDTGNLINFNESIFNPAEFDIYHNDWNTALSMSSNKTYLNHIYNDFEFLYEITQYNSWYEKNSYNPSTLFSTIQYSGMTIFEDINQNNLMDLSFERDQLENDTYYNSKESEAVYSLVFSNVSHIEVVEIYDNENPSSTEFQLLLNDPILEAIPYNLDGSMVYSPTEESNATINCFLDYYNVIFSYEQEAESSSLSVKHEMDDFNITVGENQNASVFDNLSLTVDYYIDSYSDSPEYDILAEEDSESLLSSVPSDGDFAINSAEENLIGMEFIGPYQWAKDNETYVNTVSQTPIYGYNDYYYNEIASESIYGEEEGFYEPEDDTEEIYSPSSDYVKEDYTSPEYQYQSNAYLYSMNFLNWSGYGLKMDPKFTSFLRNRRPEGLNLFQVSLIIGVIGPLVGLTILAMSKVEYRDFLRNRLLFIHTAPHRLSIEQVLENENRNLIIDLIMDEPGIHFSKISRETGLNAGNLTWHLKILELYKVVKSEVVGKFLLYFPYYDTNPISKIDFKLQKSTTTMEILNIIQENPQITQNQIAQRLSKNHKTVKYHLDKLIDADLIRSEKSGRKKLLYPIFDISPEDLEDVDQNIDFEFQ